MFKGYLSFNFECQYTWWRLLQKRFDIVRTKLDIYVLIYF